jgi:hypothetical protein
VGLADVWPSIDPRGAALFAEALANPETLIWPEMAAHVAAMLPANTVDTESKVVVSATDAQDGKVGELVERGGFWNGA